MESGAEGGWKVAQKIAALQKGYKTLVWSERIFITKLILWAKFRFCRFYFLYFSLFSLWTFVQFFTDFLCLFWNHLSGRIHWILFCPLENKINTNSKEIKINMIDWKIIYFCYKSIFVWHANMQRFIYSMILISVRNHWSLK